ncbi:MULTISPECIES: GNAT family N-acetyltransferase [Streptomyces]|uniref:GNAT family N-acetyltransferase n=1 Tax=Streptomyces TaxID=1883 RepID=UPI00084C097A|nr:MULTISPECIES: GNAT family N-acetyltransferase [Streptomyces]TFI28081.1 N-acetyltransferase [Streptomyces sp. 4R-3d]
MPELQLLRLDHAPAVLAFERENRAYFAASIPDRGDAYFTDFAALHAERLAEQATGLCYFHVLVTEEVVGRVNLVDVEDGVAELGYRIAEKAAGKGLATDAVRQICVQAAETYGLTALRAKTTDDNTASHTVLTRTGFVTTGAIDLNGRPGTTYIRTLS